MKKLRVKSPKSQKAFSLVEVIIFTAILSIVFVAIAGYVTNLVRTMKINEHRFLATHYADEAMEWIKSEREADWNALVNYATTGGTTYCFNEPLSGLTTTFFPPAGACASFNGVTGSSPRIYKRQITLRKDNNNSRLDVQITVSWEEANVVFSVPLQATLSVWE